MQETRFGIASRLQRMDTRRTELLEAEGRLSRAIMEGQEPGPVLAGLVADALRLGAAMGLRPEQQFQAVREALRCVILEQEDADRDDQRLLDFIQEGFPPIR